MRKLRSYHSCGAFLIQKIHHKQNFVEQHTKKRLRRPKAGSVNDPELVEGLIDRFWLRTKQVERWRNERSLFGVL